MDDNYLYIHYGRHFVAWIEESYEGNTYIVTPSKNDLTTREWGKAFKHNNGFDTQELAIQAVIEALPKYFYKRKQVEVGVWR